METHRRNRRNTACLIILIGILSHQALSVQASYQDPKSSGSGDEEGHGPANYDFQYGVNEGDGGNDFGHEEQRNGDTTRGQYRVLLPDGRRQVVTYTADKNGYRAQVTYENGESSGSAGGYGAPETESPSKSYTPPAADSNQGYSGGSSKGSSFGRRTGGRSFVKVRRKDIQGGNYNYSF